MSHDPADRRANVRFEVVGSLWGYLTVDDHLEIRDVSDDGVLALSRVPLPVGSIHTVTALASGRCEDVRVRVAHVREIDEPDAEYLVGLECVDDDRRFWDQVVRELVSG